MDYRTHRVAGVCTGIVASALVSPTPYTSATITTFVIVTISAGLGSYLPDIDEPKSRIGKKVKPISRAVKTIAGHRGMMHTPLTAIILTVLLLFIRGNYIDTRFSWYFSLALVGVICGFLSHLIVDSMTKGGIMWLWPISKKTFSILPLYTNNKAHQMIVKLLCIFITVLILYIYYSSTSTLIFI